MSVYVVRLEDNTVTVREKALKRDGVACAWGPFKGKEGAVRANWLAMMLRILDKKGQEYGKKPDIIFKGRGNTK